MERCNPFSLALAVAGVRARGANFSGQESSTSQVIGRMTFVSLTVVRGAHAVVVDTSALSDGVYVYRLQTSSGALRARRMVLAR